VTEDGLFQFGHSKDHRPDLPQLKINQSALDPLGIPLTTTIVSGEKADDPLYIPESTVDVILKNHAVSGLLQIEYRKEIKETPRKACRGREAYTLVEAEITVHTTLNTDAWEKTVQSLGWRVFVCNDNALSLNEAVLAYRQEYLIEHGFARYKGKTLGLTPLYLGSTTRIKGLIRLLSIGLRVLCLLEFAVRRALMNNDEKLSGIYKGNPKRVTANPTAEMMLTVFRGISLVAIHMNGTKHMELTPLTSVQEKILSLLGFSTSCYYGLSGEFCKPPDDLSER